MSDYDAVIIGSGHNGLTAAIYLAKAGWKVAVVERSEVPGGCSKSMELTLPGFIHDVHATNISLFGGSTIMSEMGQELMDAGFAMSANDQPYGNVFPDGDCLLGYMDPKRMVDEIGRHSAVDARAWAKMLDEFGRLSGHLLPFLKMPMPSLKLAWHFVKAYRALGTDGFMDLASVLLKSSGQFVDYRFESEKVKALFAPWGFHLDFGPQVAGGAMFPYLEVPLDYMYGLPFATGGLSNLINAMITLIKNNGGEVMLGQDVTSVRVAGGRAVGVGLANGEAIGATKAVIANVTPPKLFGSLVPAEELPGPFMTKVKNYRYGPGTMMIHLALDGPVPWKAGEAVSHSSYVHVAPYLADISQAYHEASSGYLPKSPLLIVGQQSRVDPSRAPEGKETLWIQVRGVPIKPIGDAAGTLSGDDWDQLREPYADRMIDKLEEYAPGLKDIILARKVMSPVDLERDNPNLVNGDSVSGSHHMDQYYMFRPFAGWSRYKTPIKNLYMIGASTWPGAGLNATSGYLVAQDLIK